jgi:hypothetical protein
MRNALVSLIFCATGIILVAQAPSPGPLDKAAVKKARREGRLKPGDDAPDFELRLAKSTETVRVSRFEGKKAVALVFGSYT